MGSRHQIIIPRQTLLSLLKPVLLMFVWTEGSPGTYFPRGALPPVLCCGWLKQIPPKQDVTRSSNCFFLPITETRLIVYLAPFCYPVLGTAIIVSRKPESEMLEPNCGCWRYLDGWGSASCQVGASPIPWPLKNKLSFLWSNYIFIHYYYCFYLLNGNTTKSNTTDLVIANIQECHIYRPIW